jgi:hypothetical protein
MTPSERVAEHIRRSRHYRYQAKVMEAASKDWRLDQDSRDYYRDQKRVFLEWAREHEAKAEGVRERL